MAYTLHEPIGVVGQIIPWNFPLLMAACELPCGADAVPPGCCAAAQPPEGLKAVCSLPARHLQPAQAARSAAPARGRRAIRAVAAASAASAARRLTPCTAPARPPAPAGKLAPALACGNTVVMKVSEQTPLTALKVRAAPA